MNTILKIEELIKIEEKSISIRKLILHNDDVNSFDYVINTLIEILQYSSEQACQATYIAHHRGSHIIKEDMDSVLLKYKEQFTSKNIIVTIE